MAFVKLTYFSLLGNQADSGKYPEYCCVFLFCWLFTRLSFYIYVFQFTVCSFCVILSLLQTILVNGQQSCWLEVIPTSF